MPDNFGNAPDWSTLPSTLQSNHQVPRFYLQRIQRQVVRRFGESWDIHRFTPMIVALEGNWRLHWSWAKVFSSHSLVAQITLRHTLTPLSRVSRQLLEIRQGTQGRLQPAGWLLPKSPQGCHRYSAPSAVEQWENHSTNGNNKRRKVNDVTFIGFHFHSKSLIVG